MAIREKARALFRTKSNKTDRDSLSKTSTQNSDRERWPSNVYKPGEPMPRPKYRATPKKEHKEKLESFSFAEAWRRKSFQSQYSPMGTRAPSRRNSHSRRSSWISMGRKSFSRKSEDRSNSYTSGDTEKSKPREHLGAARATALSTEPEQEGDDDIGNVGVSRIQSKDRTEERADPTNINGLAKTMSTAHDHQPFTEQELALAMSRSHLAVPAQ